MAISIDWPSGVIMVPQADLTPLGGDDYELDLNTFRLALKDLEDDEGMPFPDTHRHNTQVNLGGVLFARLIEIINGYTVTFEDAVYAVSLVGANSNILDVTNLNQVSVRSANSGGLIVHESGTSGLTPTESADLAQAKADAAAALAEARLARKLLDADEVLTEDATGNWTLVDSDDGVTVLRTRTVKDKTGAAITLPEGAPATRTKV